MSAAVRRPRPRPRPFKATSSIEVVKPGSSANAGSSKSVIEDEDAMFIRNKNRNANGWKTMNQAVKKTEESRRSPSKDRLSDVDLSESSSPHSKRTKRFTSKVKELPKWTKTGELSSTYSLTSSDSENSDSEILINSTPRGKAVESTPKGKRKRDKSRSLSLTPPPPLPTTVTANTHAIVSRVLGISPPPQHSPPIEVELDESDEIEELAPELARIADRVGARGLSAPSRTNIDPSNSAMIELRIRMLSHPEDESGKIKIFSHRLGRNESFSHLFDEVAEQYGIATEDVIVTYDNKKVFAASTPATLSIWSGAELEVCSDNIFNYIKEQESAHMFAPSVENSNTLGNVTAETDPAAFASTDSGAESDVSHDKGDTFRLHLRSGAETVTVTVRPTTKCSAIVASFLRKMGKPATGAKKARVEVDGEKMCPDSCIGDADLENGDLVDIVGV
ncbi:hypothetical protein EW145_g4751 [Phellinidium pouzarii]|uniref:Rad60/SUMO-like domain-containing protein n=1 Tax=Phellinidium pouzarii TaxID=167371 RepID=A0A4S4L783_9AGAM|nr:hypothetical protein EW145_g4751 [Phellinidium pouzarii]